MHVMHIRQYDVCTWLKRGSHWRALADRCNAPTLARASTWAARLSGTTTLKLQFDEYEFEIV